MFIFSIKFIKSMLWEWKKEISFVVIGIVLCVCVIINFADSFYSFTTMYWGAETKEDLNYNENRMNYTFSGADKLREVVDDVRQIDGVEEVYLRGETEEGIDILTGTCMPRITENGVMTGIWPEKLDDGEFVASLKVLSDLRYASPDNESLSDYMASGEKISISGKELVCVAETGDIDEFILSQNDFIEICNIDNIDRIDMYYIYEDGFTEIKKQEVTEKIKEIKTPVSIEQQETMKGYKFSEFMEQTQSLILGAIIAILNAMFLYINILERRIPAYSILKLQGLSNAKLRVMLFSEFILLFLLSFAIGICLYVVAVKISDGVLYNTLYSGLYTFLMLFCINMVIFAIVSWKLVRRQPFEIYSYR